jgi:hypothetical protein
MAKISVALQSGSTRLGIHSSVRSTDALGGSIPNPSNKQALAQAIKSAAAKPQTSS